MINADNVKKIINTLLKYMTHPSFFKLLLIILLIMLISVLEGRKVQI